MEERNEKQTHQCNKQRVTKPSKLFNFFSKNVPKREAKNTLTNYGARNATY